MGKRVFFDIYSGVFPSKMCVSEWQLVLWERVLHYSTIDLYFKLDESEVKSVSI